jgi:hypothetical protein
MIALALFAFLGVAAVLAVGAIGTDRRIPIERVAVRRADDGRPLLDGAVFTTRPPSAAPAAHAAHAEAHEVAPIRRE